MRVHIVDPPAYTPPYDHALCGALADAGVDVELITSPFTYAANTANGAYRTQNGFYRRSRGSSGSRLRQLGRLTQHVPDMIRYSRGQALNADLIHFQWLTVQQIDAILLPKQRPLVLTAHDILPREPQPGQHAGQRRIYDRMDAVVAHSEHGAERLREEVGLDRERVHVIPHGVFHHLTEFPEEAPLPPELQPNDGPVVLFFGLIRPYKGLDLLLEAWKEVQAACPNASLWVVGMPRMDIHPLQNASQGLNVQWVPRYVAGSQLAATFRAADMVVLPYREIDQSGVLFTALAFGKPVVLSDVGGFPETAMQTGAAELFPMGDVAALTNVLSSLATDDLRRDELARAAASASSPTGPLGWSRIAHQTIELYESLLQESPVQSLLTTTR